MKNFKNIFLAISRILASSYIRLKEIEVVAITGSAGKTTARHAIKTVLANDKSLYVPEENYNTESGIPSAIFQLRNPESTTSLLPWCNLLFKMLLKFIFKAPYKTIVLEFSADKPGDIEYLISIAKPHIAIVTTVIPAHMQGFGNIETIAHEKGTTVRALSEADFAILNFDNKYVKDMANKTEGKVLSTGSDKKNSLHFEQLKYNETGMVLNLFWKDQKALLEVPVLAPHLIPSLLAAITLALLRGNSLNEAASKMIKFVPEQGRMRILKGKNGSTIIDDSYNSNPESAKAALEVLSHFSGHKIAVLGSMNELGDYAKKGHEEVAETAAKIADEVVVVGEVAGKYLYPVVLKKLNKKFVRKFETSKQAGEYLQDIVTNDDVLLFKGSQNGVFIEEALKYVLLDPQKAPELLVRQSPMWQNKKGNS